MNAGVNVVFDGALDGPVWRGRGPHLGTLAVGPKGLLARLELELGIAHVEVDPRVRAARLVGRLTSTEGFWSRSSEVDPLATARRLLASRDHLAMCGWRGQPTGTSLDALWTITSDAAPGVPDRIARLRATMSRRRRCVVDSVEVLESPSLLEPAWRDVLEMLAATGTRIANAIRAPSLSSRTTDLARACDPAFTPVGDGSLQLARTHGPLATAEVLAHALASVEHRELTGSVVVVSPDAMLADALTRHGLPRLGVQRPTAASAALVRICIEAAFAPMAIGNLHALLCLDPGPIPRGIAWSLNRALSALPARGSRRWIEALDEGIAAIEDEQQRETLRARIAALIDPLVGISDSIPVDAIEARMNVLASWARGREADEPTLAEVSRRAAQLIELVRAHGAPGFTRELLLRMCDELDTSFVDGPAGEAGLVAVHEPGAIIAPASVVIWWGFTRDREAVPPRYRVSREERAALAAIGVTLPSPAVEAAAVSRRWRRVLDHATECLILACPHFDAVGDAAHANPLWDQLQAAMPVGAAARLVTSNPRVVLAGRARDLGWRVVESRATPRYASVARTRIPLALVGETSVSGVEQLLGCSLAHVLSRVGKIRSRMTARPTEPSPLLYGTLAHELLADRAGDTSVVARLDRDLLQLAEALALPELRPELAALRRVLERAGRRLAGLGDASREISLAGSLGGLAITGRADLIRTEPPMVIDLKWGARRYRDLLRGGAAVQLAVYAALAFAEQRAGAAYVAMRDDVVVAATGTAIAQSVEVGPPIQETVNRVAVAIEAKLAELSEGTLFAPGAEGTAIRASAVDAEGILRIGPACSYCELDAICGRRGAR